MTSQELGRHLYENELEKAKEKFEETGDCVWCMGDREIVNDRGMEGEWVELCPICHPNAQKDGNDWRENEKDNNI